MKLFTSRRLALVISAVGVTVLATVFVACNGDDNSNPNPVVFDSGTSVTDSSVNNSDTSTSTQGDSSSDSSSVSDSAQQSDTSVVIIDSSLPDAGNCVSDAEVKYDAQVCNSCYTVEQDPLNACSAYTVNCIPFDNSRVPSGAP